jgi:hypothetical protein
METWTLGSGDRWKRWGHPGVALDAMSTMPSTVTQLLVIDIEVGDQERTAATIHLARRIAVGPLQVIAGSLHPTRQWSESVRRAGADRVLFIARRKAGWHLRNPHLTEVVELDDRVCPALHVTHDQDLTLSVCGRRHDRMVLARPHLDGWCLKHNSACPHWRPASDALPRGESHPATDRAGQAHG